MLDEFQRPDGPVTGSTPPIGPAWVTTPSYTTHLITSDEAVGQVPSGSVSGNQVNSIFSAPQLAAAWWIRWVFRNRTSPSSPPTSLGAWFGSDADNVFFGCLLQVTATPDVANAEFIAGNVQDGDIDVTVPMSMSDVHEVVFQWDGAGGCSVLLDDVEIGSATGITIDPATNRDFEFYMNRSGSSEPVFYRLVELGIGFYDA